LKLVLDSSAVAKWFIVEEESRETGKLRELQVLWRESRIFYFRSVFLGKIYLPVM